MGEELIKRGARYRLDAQGIIRGFEENGADFGISDAEEAMEVIRKLGGGGKRCLLMDISKLRTMSREARAFFMKPEHTEILHAVALLIGSPLSRAIGNIFLGLNRPVTPTRLFTDEEAALAWLRTFLEPGPK
jgi:hypothetical protein